MLHISCYLMTAFFFRCVIDLSKLQREKTHNIWVDLEDGNGQIFLLLTISGTTQSETITDLTSYRENPKDKEIIERRYVCTIIIFARIITLKAQM